MTTPITLTRQPPINAAVTEVVNVLSPSVQRIRYSIDQDWTGEWGISFRVLLSDDAAKKSARSD